MQIPTKPRKKVREAPIVDLGLLQQISLTATSTVAVSNNVSSPKYQQKFTMTFQYSLSLPLKEHYLHVVHVTGQIHCYKELVPSKDSLKYALEKEKVY